MLQNQKYIYHSEKKIERILKSFFLLHPENVDLSLNRIKRLLIKLNNPHLKIRNVVQIAGTNGKGSIATILYELQKRNGKKVNIYRSPHLISFNETISRFSLGTSMPTDDVPGILSTTLRLGTDIVLAKSFDKLII